MAKATKRRAPRGLELGDSDGVVIPFSRKRGSAKDKKSAKGSPSTDHHRSVASAPLTCMNKAQRNYKQKIESSTITFGVGPAGTGKTYVAVKIAAALLEQKEIQQIIVARPAVGVEEDYGALPGTIDEKMSPWFAPVLDILNTHFGASHVEGMMKTKRIRFVPLAHLRGLTFDNAFILLDEAQNTSPKQMKALLTRIGQNSKLVIDGDMDQCDIPSKSGLNDAVERLKDIASISVHTFTEEDIVRNGLIKDILKAYRKNDTAAEPASV